MRGTSQAGATKKRFSSEILLAIEEQGSNTDKPFQV